MESYILDVQNLKFGFPNAPLIFEGLTFGVRAGETIGLVGSNGAGKSTLLKLLVGLVDKQQGEIQICGINQAKKTLASIRQKVGLAFQDTDSQLFMTTVYEDVAFGPRNMDLSEEKVDSLTRKALGQVEAEHLVDRPPYTLSGGEKRQVSLATVLSMSPEIILLDEPTTGLDPRARRNLIMLMQRLSQTKIIATHDMDMALEICDQIMVLNEGHLEAMDVPQVVFKNKDLLKRCRLEQPLSMQKCPVCGS